MSLTISFSVSGFVGKISPFVCQPGSLCVDVDVLSLPVPGVSLET